MDRWKDRVAVVTGASAGIGAALVKDLVKAGLIVVGLARREERVQEIRKQLPQNLQSRLHPLKCDVSKEEDVKKAFKWVDKQLGGADILVNNAGVVRATELVKPDNTKDIRETVETNIMGVVYCTREAFNSMKARNIDGHIVIINSISGHRVPIFGNRPSSNIYPSTKFAVTAMVETLRQEFQKHNTNVKISSISPGAVNTEIFPEDVRNFFETNNMPMLRSEDVSNAIMYVLGTPPHVQIHELTIKPMGEKY